MNVDLLMFMVTKSPRLQSITMNTFVYHRYASHFTSKQGWCKGSILAISEKALKFENFNFLSILGLIDNDLKRIYC